MIDIILPLLVFFAEPNFPVVDVSEMCAVPSGAVVCENVEGLAAELTPGRVLVWRHGSSFPAELWPAFVQFLERGGSFVYLGGEPFTRTVVGTPGARMVQSRSMSLLKELRLNQCHRIQIPSGATVLESGQVLGEATWGTALEPRLSDTKDFVHEDGAPGSRDGYVHPLMRLSWGSEPDYPQFTSTLAVDRIRGRFAGGRWIFRLIDTACSEQEVRGLASLAQGEPCELRVDPTYGCYHAGERPSLTVGVTRSRGGEASGYRIDLQLVGPSSDAADGPPLWTHSLELSVAKHGFATVPIALDGLKPGLYRVRAKLHESKSGNRVLPPFTTGFWIRDTELLLSGDTLTFDGSTLLRNGASEPVVGVTTMSGTVHRKFLFEPNAAVWDETFRELRDCGVNLVRTGIWSGFRKISLDPGAIDEAFLRNLEGYYLSARRHGIPILFTFFAFVPESFGGASPYFDPRSIEGQQAYVSAIVSRFVGAKEMLWDLINEPSFASPDRLWFGRPHGDAHESAAFVAWLKDRYRDAPGGWEAEVRSRWRLRPDEAIGLPVEADFSDRQVMEAHRPYRAKEWLHFAQGAFARWVSDMSVAIRSAGSNASITVGQDEGGLSERPNPLYHADRVDYTSMHSWWYNDALYFDGVMAKAAGKPLLVSETGIMNRELLSGETIRTPRTSAQLLSRKIGYAFAAGAFGVVEWCYDVNPYMASDNEVAIGLKRVDGSYKPEHDVLRQLGRFLTREPSKFVEPKPPRVAVIHISSDHYSPRGTQLDRLKRTIDIFGRELRVPVQVVAEYRTTGALDDFDMIVVPSAKGIASSAWRDIVAAAERGAIVLASGYFEFDDAGRPAHRLGVERRELFSVEAVSGLAQPGRFPLDVIQSEFAVDRESYVQARAVGRGFIVHAALPVEAATSDRLAHRFYRDGLSRAGVAPRVRVVPDDPAVLVRAFEYLEETLVVVVNEQPRSVSLELVLPQGRTTVLLPPGEATFYVFDSNDRLLRSSHRSP